MAANGKLYHAILTTLELTDGWGNTESAFSCNELYADAANTSTHAFNLAF